MNAARALAKALLWALHAARPNLAAAPTPTPRFQLGDRVVWWGMHGTVEAHHQAPNGIAWYLVGFDRGGALKVLPADLQPEPTVDTGALELLDGWDEAMFRRDFDRYRTEGLLPGERAS